jgi:hypothetical protein
MKVSSLYAVAAFLGVSFLLAGCSTSQSPAVGSLPANSAAGAAQQLHNDGKEPRCQDGNLAVFPCPITFDASNPGPTVVKVGEQGNHFKLKESDDCASSGVATVTQVKPHQWSVAAGSTTGSCTATFKGRGGQGNGVDLPITNTL